MSQDLEKRFRELNLKVTLQETAIKVLIRHIIKEKPELEITKAFDEFLAETMLHFGKGLAPDLAEKAEAYFQSLVVPHSR